MQGVVGETGGCDFDEWVLKMILFLKDVPLLLNVKSARHFVESCQ